MTTKKRPDASEELAQIEEALVDELLKLSGAELRDEVAAIGLDPERCLADFDAALAAAKAESARIRLDAARAELVDWRNRMAEVRGDAISAASGQLQRLRSDGPAGNVMLAARKGRQQLSNRDEEGLLKDLADLEILEPKDKDE